MLISMRCSGCGTEFQKEHWSVNKTRNFCSLECKWKSERTTLICDCCGNSFTKKSSISNKKRKFCSRSCYIAWKKKAGRVSLVCQQCGKKFSRQKSVPIKSYTCCSIKCQADYQKKDRVINPHGYIWIWVDEVKVLEHRFVMEQYLGRKLSDDEIVHHINEVKSDNRIENLSVMSSNEHTRLHWKGRKHTTKTRKKISDAVRRAYADPAKSKRMREGIAESNRKRAIKY